MLKPFTVICFDNNTSQICAYHVMAKDGQHAFGVTATTPGMNCDLLFVTSVDGHLKELEGIYFPSEKLVDSQTIISQPEVFGGTSTNSQ